MMGKPISLFVPTPQITEPGMDHRKRQIRFNAKYVSFANSILTTGSYLTVLLVAILFGGKVRVSAGGIDSSDYGPWSISALTGIDFPERSIYQIFSAIAAGPRIVFLLTWYKLVEQILPSYGKLSLVVGVVRLLFAGGCIYVTETDDGYTYDLSRIAYVFLGIIWYAIICKFSREALKDQKANKIMQNWAYRTRRYIVSAFLGSLILAIHFYTQHRIYHIAGAYVKYQFFEWVVVALDLAFDSVAYVEFSKLRIDVATASGPNMKVNFEV